MGIHAKDDTTGPQVINSFDVKVPCLQILPVTHEAYAAYIIPQRRQAFANRSLWSFHVGLWRHVEPGKTEASAGFLS